MYLLDGITIKNCRAGVSHRKIKNKNAPRHLDGTNEVENQNKKTKKMEFS